MKQQYVVENIKCGGCSNTIQSALQKIQAVNSVAIDIDLGVITIEGNPDRKKVIENLNEMGYPEVGNNSLFKKTKSYVSCAIGKITKK
jgi:copper chaperone CopZ